MVIGPGLIKLESIYVTLKSINGASISAPCQFSDTIDASLGNIRWSLPVHDLPTGWHSLDLIFIFLVSFKGSIYVRIIVLVIQEVDDNRRAPACPILHSVCTFAFMPLHSYLDAPQASPSGKAA